jgi:DNA-binding NtrC family response regulator
MTTIKQTARNHNWLGRFFHSFRDVQGPEAAESVKEKGLIIFLVEDDPQYSSGLKYDLESHTAHTITCFSSGEDCVENLKRVPDVVLLDYFLDGKMNGLDVLKHIKKYDENIQVVLLSGQDKIEVAANALKLGAYDYVVKNQSAFIRIRSTISRLLRLKNLVKENGQFRQMWVVFLVMFTGFLGLMYYLTNYVF